MEQSNWTFQDASSWGNQYPNCSASEQSPINIETENLIQCKSLCEVKFLYKKNTQCKVNYANSLLKFIHDKDSFIDFKGVTYELKYFTVHTPSLHTIDGESYDMEICFVHSMDGDNDVDNGVIISCLYQRGVHHGPTEQFFNEIINDIPIDEIAYNKRIEVSEEWGTNLLLPKSQAFYSYIGSLPYPPCTEKYTYLVMTEIGNIGPSTLELIKNSLGKTTRRVKPLNDREIFFNTGYKFDAVNKSSETKSSDKFLKCVKLDMDKPVRNIEIKKDTHQGPGIKPETLKRIKDILLVITIILMLITSIFFVKYLHIEKKQEDGTIKGGYIKKILQIFVGNKVQPNVWNNWNKHDSCSSKPKASSGQTGQTGKTGQSGKSQ